METEKIMSSVICVKIDMHNKTMAKEKFPTIKAGFLAEMDKNPGAKILRPKVFIKDGIIFIEINAFMESVAKKLIPTIKSTLVKDFLAQAKKDGFEASIECYLKE